MAEWKPKIVNGVIRMADTKANRINLERWVRSKIDEYGQFTDIQRPKIPPNLPKIFLGGDEFGAKNKARAGPSDASKFKLISKKIGKSYNVNREARIALANLNPLNKENYRKWNDFVKGIMHHSGPAAATGQLVARIEQLADANWKPSMGITSAGKNFLRNLYKRLDVHGGNSLLNFDFYDTEQIHAQAHRILKQQGVDLQRIGDLTQTFKHPNDVYSWVKNTYKPAIDKVTSELGDFSLRKLIPNEGTASLFQRTPHLFKDFLAQHKDKITKAGMLKVVTSAPKTLAAQADMFIPDKEVADEFKAKRWGSALTMYRDQLGTDIATAGLFSGMTKAIMSKAAPAAGGIGGGGVVAGLLPFAVTGYALHRLDENVFEGEGKKRIHEGLTTVVENEEEDKSRNYLGSYAPY
jgi:hypothetical protein